jgi:Fe-S-cluster-containing dehydrogenase component/formate-dependent nitrite reductase membrane component NrfD
MNYGFVIDNRSCIGCHACSTACKSENSVPLGVNRTWVKYTEVGRYPDVQRHFQVTRCNHCANPPCVRICPVSAMYQREDGIVEFDGDACIGCKACLQACPYDAVYIDPDSGTAAKCHFCGHRVSQGLEPACVVVCPTHSIIAGDMDDPASEIAKVLASTPTSVRKPELNTEPNLFYIEGHPANLVPTATERQPAGMVWSEVLPIHDDTAMGGPIFVDDVRVAEQMVQVAYNAQHKVPWHWQVPAYMLTKSISTGLWLLLALGVFLPLDIPPDRVGGMGLAGIVFALITTVLLVLDLERPERFLRILTRPQWRSWLTRGAFLLIGFSGVSGLWWAKHVVLGPGAVDGVLAVLTIPLAIGAAIYTAFLFAQAEGRDLWQSKLLAPHLFVQSVFAGSAAWLILEPLSGQMSLHGTMATVFTVALLADLLLAVLDILILPHRTSTARAAVHAIRRGRYRVHFWVGGLLLGHLLPLALVWNGGVSAAVAGLAALVGLYLYEHAYVYAPQDIPNS